MDLLQNLLGELGGVLRIAGLTTDKNNTCMIKMKNGLNVYIELDREGKNLIIGSDLGAIPPGKYRENFFREAMKANGMSPPRHGILSFARKTEHVVIFEKFPTEDMNGSRMAEVLEGLSLKAEIWRSCLARGEVPKVDVFNRTTGSGGGSGMFGLIP